MKKMVVIWLLVGLSFPLWATEFHYELRVDGLACPYCAYGIEKKLKALDGVNRDSIDVKLNQGLVVFEADTEDPLTEDSLKTLVNDAGFTLRGFTVQALNAN